MATESKVGNNGKPTPHNRHSGGAYTVGAVSDLVGVSVRTLHHWDDIGLMHPSDRTSGGYRSYSDADVARIHQILVYRDLGFDLARIAALLDDPETSEVDQLVRQRTLLLERMEYMRGVVGAIDQVIAARQAGRTLTVQEQSQIFGVRWKREWAEEAYSRWGESPAWSEFESRLHAMDDATRDAVRQSGELLFDAMIDAKRSGVASDSEAARALVEQHRTMIGQLFECPHSLHTCFADMFVEDMRFHNSLDQMEPGLDIWLRDAIYANATTCKDSP